MVRELTRNETDTLIERHIEPHPDPVKEGHAWYRLKERGVPVYAIIGSMTPTLDNGDDVADAFAVSREAVNAAVPIIASTRRRLTHVSPRIVSRKWRHSS